jgi:hypothetical protein
MNLREKVSYANVASTLALVVALTGGAYAAGVIDSGDIKNNSIESRDLKNRDAVKARDVRRNTLTGREVKEKTLDASLLAPLSGRQTDGCDPVPASFIPCATAQVRLASHGRVLAIATGQLVDNDAGGALSCRIELNGGPTDATATVTADGGAEESFELALTTGRLPAGQHQLSLRCQEEADDGELSSAAVVVLGVGDGR